MFQDSDPDIAALFTIKNLLPETLPESPLGIILAWMDEAKAAAHQPNPSAMTLATADDQGVPSARIVLCRGVDADRGVFTFFTNRASRKGQDISVNPNAALVFHWDHMDRQIRVEGPVVETSDEVSDVYFASRSVAKRLGAWSSDQSQIIQSRKSLIERVQSAAEQFGINPLSPDGTDEAANEITRPPHWGGYHVHARTVEIWAGENGRIHDRAVWRRELTANANTDPMLVFDASEWSSNRLQP